MSGNDANLIRAMRGPVTLITVGVLFALNNFTPYRFEQTWPVLLIVFGLMSLLRRGTEPAMAPPPAGAPYSYPPPASSYPPPAQGTGYRQSPYTGTAGDSGEPTSGAAMKGGFGSSAPPRSPDPGQAPPAGEAL